MHPVMLLELWYRNRTDSAHTIIIINNSYPLVGVRVHDPNLLETSDAVKRVTNIIEFRAWG